MSLLKSSAANNCLTLLTNLSIKANRVDPIRLLIWVHTVCHRGFLNISADEKKQTTFIAISALRVKLLFRTINEYSYSLQC